MGRRKTSTLNSVSEVTPLTGWVTGAANDPQHHWAERGKALCWKPIPPGAQLLCAEPMLPNWRRPRGHWVRYCPTCLSRVVIREAGLPFRVGDYVQSRALGMTLRGKVAAVFIDDDGLPMLNITRIWTRAQEAGDWAHDTSPHDWYRHASECRPWEGPAAKRAPRKPRPGGATPRPGQDAALPPDEVRRRLGEIQRSLRRR